MDIDSPSKSRNLHVLIIGAGITGLAIAQGLQKVGIRFSIYDAELSQAIRTREWTLAIHWSKPTLEKLQPAALYARLSEAYCDPFYEYTAENSSVPIYNGKNGGLMNQLVAPTKVKSMSIPKYEYLRLTIEHFEVESNLTSLNEVKSN